MRSEFSFCTQQLYTSSVLYFLVFCTCQVFALISLALQFNSFFNYYHLCTCGYRNCTGHVAFIGFASIGFDALIRVSFFVCFWRLPISLCTLSVSCFQLCTCSYRFFLLSDLDFSIFALVDCAIIVFVVLISFALHLPVLELTVFLAICRFCSYQLCTYSYGFCTYLAILLCTYHFCSYQLLRTFSFTLIVLRLPAV